MASPPPRLAPSRPFPSAAYVPGVRGTRPPEPPPCPLLDPDQFSDTESFRYGVDLFHHRFFWEAHAEWEALWHATGRRGPIADRVRALIRLAAAGVKVEQRRASGVTTHLEGARTLLLPLLSACDPRFDELDLASLVDRIESALLATTRLGDPPDWNPIVAAAIFVEPLLVSATRASPRPDPDR